MRVAHIVDLRAEDIDVDIGSGEHDVLELRRKTVIANCHLAERL